MRFLTKGPEPLRFTRWKGQANADWQPTWGNFGGAVKARVKRELLREQGCLCAYCCERTDAAHSHIEHVVPRKGRYGNAGRALDYTNFVASCPGEPKDTEEEATAETPEVPAPVRTLEQHCGHAKGDADPAGLVLPNDPACARAFLFTEEGEILADPSGPDPARAAHTIKRLNLNADRLKRRRRIAVEGFREELEVQPPAEQDRRLQAIQMRQADGAYVEFYPALVSVLGPEVAAAVLRAAGA